MSEKKVIKNPQARLRICKTCPYFYKILQTCKKCGCAVRSKTLKPNQKCPVGKW